MRAERGRSGALALAHYAFLPRHHVTPSPSEYPCARPSASHHCKPVRDAPSHIKGQVPRTAQRSKGITAPLPRRHLPTRPPSSHAPASRRFGGNRTLVFLTLVSPSQERGVGSPTFTKGPIEITPGGWGGVGKMLRAPRPPCPRKKRHPGSGGSCVMGSTAHTVTRLDPRMSSVGWERYLVAFRGSAFTEQGTIGT